MQLQTVLPMDVVHLRRVELDVEPAHLDHLAQLLSTDEQIRAARFHFDRDRDLFVAGRGLLRETLAHYINAPPSSLRFAYSAHGKPSLADPAYNWLRFNVSHSEGIAVFAVAQGREVGVDIEHVGASRVEDVPRVAARVLCGPERRILEASAPGRALQTLLHFWTRKEAYIKADGRGLSLPLQYIDVSNSSGLIKINDPTQAAGQWHLCPKWRLQNWTTDTDAVIAVAAEGADWHLVPHP